MEGVTEAPRTDRETKRVFLHVGSPKTGSTFLQEVLWSQREKAERQGLLLPLSSFFDHFLGTVDVRELTDQERFPERARGIWNRIVEAGLRWPGDVLVSHELFAAATADQAERAVKAWGDDAEVHVIVTARDLARQIPAEWQEHIKHRSSITFSDFVDALRLHSRESEWFWLVQDFADVCRRWGTAVPAAHVHVVTVPAAGASSDLLWRRFATLLDLDPEAFDLTATRSNASLKAEQAELLRRLNAGLGDRLPIPGSYPSTVKETLAQEILQGRPGTPIALDENSRAFARKRSLDLVSELEELGVDVVGALDELVPADPSTAGGEAARRPPEALSEASLLPEGLAALTGVLERLAEVRERASTEEHERRRNQDELDAIRRDFAELRQRHDKLVADMRERPLRHFFIGLSETRPWLMRQRVRYWHTVERVRRLTRRGPAS